MYNLEEMSIEQLHNFIEKYNFASLINQNNGDFFVTHIPVMLDRHQGDYGTIIGHMAKVNSNFKMFDINHNSLCIFQGPHSYISPTWYRSSPNVPTWNYAVVHAYGKPTLVSKEQLSDDLTQMVNYNESKYDINTSYNISDDYKNRLIDHIVGFRMEILRIEHRFKLGQNKNPKDQEGILHGLREQNTFESLSFLDFCVPYLKG